MKLYSYSNKEEYKGLRYSKFRDKTCVPFEGFWTKPQTRAKYELIILNCKKFLRHLYLYQKC